MATAEAAVLVLALIACLGACIAEEYTVGDRAGWQPGNVDYQQWAARHSYRVGDSLLFAYDRGSQSVMRVSSEDYHVCRTHRPIEHHVSGSTLIHLKRDDYYFISGVDGHCNAGMKLAVILAGGSPSAAPSVTKPPPTVATPPTIAPVVPPTLPPPAIAPVAPPTPAPFAIPPLAPVSPPVASTPPSPTEAPASVTSPPTQTPAPVSPTEPPVPSTSTPTPSGIAPVPSASTPTPSGLAPSPPAPLPFGPPAESPTPPPPSAASVLQSTLSAVIIAAVGSFSLLL